MVMVFFINYTIPNEKNDWARETMGNAKYPLELFLRGITNSLETQKKDCERTTQA